MFRHIGKTRKHKHNLRIASLLSFVAGIVNVVGFLSVQRLTTNVTGHFAFLIDEVFKLNLFHGFIFLLYIFFFWFGSFVSSFLVELMYKRNKNYIYLIPVFLESLLLLFVAFFGKYIPHASDTIAFMLLFSMGLQNSLVTSISKSVVRTTHLTGLFTDLGIEMSQFFFYTQPDQRQKLISSIRLRFTIISFFFIGGVFSGFLYSKLQLHVLIIPSLLLIFGAAFDLFRYTWIKLKRKLSSRN